MKGYLPFSVASVVLVIFFIACGRNKTERQFAAFVDKHVAVVEPLMKELNLSYWDATASGKVENYDRYGKLQLDLRRVYSNREEFAQLQAFKKSGKIKQPLLARQLTLLHNAYLENQIDTTLIKQLVELSTAIENQFNTFRGKIDGKQVTGNQILDILKGERHSEMRRKAWEASKQVGPVVAEHVVELVKLRNEAARQLGFDNFYTMRLTLAEQDEAELVKLFDELQQLTDAPFRQLKAESDSILAPRYGLSPEALRPWHYHDPFFQEAPKIFEVDLDQFYAKQDVKELARRFFEGIGLPIDDVLSRSDLYEREKKYPHAYSTDIDRRGDVRVMANLKNDEYSMDTILHEMGHAVYSRNIDPRLPFLLRTEAHTFTTEAIAIFFGRLARNASWLQDMGVITTEEKTQIEPISRKSQRLAALVFARWCQVMFRFERELYKNPAQDLNKLWWDLVEANQHVYRPAERKGAADWAAKIHIASYPAYYHNYMLGELLASQLHAHIATKVLPVSSGRDVGYVNHPEVGRYLREKIFRPGASYRWDELVRRATGERLGARYFVEQFVNM